MNYLNLSSLEEFMAKRVQYGSKSHVASHCAESWSLCRVVKLVPTSDSSIWSWLMKDKGKGAKSWQCTLVLSNDMQCWVVTVHIHSKACFIHSVNHESPQYVHITFISYKSNFKTSISHSNSYKFTKNNENQKHL